MKRIAVVGVIVDDHIVRADGSSVRSLGGLMYAVNAAAALAGSGVEVVPVCRVARALGDRLQEEWSAFGNVSDSGLVLWSGPASQVILEYQEGGRIGGDREERLLHPTPPLDALEIEVALAADAILLNCVTGAVLTGGALAKVSASAVPVYLDVHSLVLGRAGDGARYPKRPADWTRWVDAADTMQCNEQEAAVLAGPPPAHDPSLDAVDRFVRATSARPSGPHTVVVTRGAGGADLFERGTLTARLPAPRLRPVDPTGAGDTFGAAFVAARLSGADAESAAEAAVEAASASCLSSGTAAIAALPEAIALLDDG